VSVFVIAKEPAMATEIERKFIVKSGEWRSLAHSASRLRQGYICVAVPPIAAEVRIRCTEDRGFVTVKGPGSLIRAEFEYEIPLADADLMLKEFCSKQFLEKTRYLVDFAGVAWEIDEYSGPHRGLVVAEVELSVSTQSLQLPTWIGKEVTDDPRFKNAYLAANPQSWQS
jgi:adenylate cyclase